MNGECGLVLWILRMSIGCGWMLLRIFVYFTKLLCIICISKVLYVCVRVCQNETIVSEQGHQGRTSFRKF